MEVERYEMSRWNLEKLQRIDPPRELFSQLQEIVYIKELSLATLNSEADLLMNLVFVHKLHEVVVAEVSFLVMVQIYQESLDHFIDRDLRDFLRLDLSKEISKDPLNRLKVVSKRNCIHHLDFSAFILISHYSFTAFLRRLSLRLMFLLNLFSQVK